MPSAIDRVGCFRGRIKESGVGATKNGFPQFTLNVGATQRYVEDKAEMEALGLTEPGWVDWSGYEQDLTGYLVLIDGKGQPIFHMEGIQRALGWDGASFATLGSTDWSAKEFTFWVEENDYNGQVSLRIAAVDSIDAPPHRTLRKMDANELKDLDAKFAGMLAGKKAAVKPASAPAKAPASGKPAPGKAPPGKPAPSPAAGAVPSTTASAPTSTPAPKTAPSKAPPAKAKAEAAPFAAGMTKETAWNAVIEAKGEASDDAVAEAWVDAAGAVCPGNDDEDSFTPANWAAIAEAAKAKLKA